MKPILVDLGFNNTLRVDPAKGPTYYVGVQLVRSSVVSENGDVALGPAVVELYVTQEVAVSIAAAFSNAQFKGEES